MIKVLLTSAGGELAPLISQNFKNMKKFRKVVTIGVDIKKQSVNKHFFDYFYKVSISKKKYLKDIKKIVKKHNVNLILPASDEEALMLSSDRKNIEKGKVAIACTENKNIKIFSDKVATYKALEKNKIRVGKWDLAHNKKEIVKKINNFLNKNKSVVIKPSVSRGGRNVFIINKKKTKILFNPNDREIELSYADFKNRFINDLKNFYPIIVMEKLYGPTYDLDMLCKNGNLINGITRRRLVSSMPNEGNLITNNKKILNIGKEIARVFNLNWLYDCDFMFDRKKNPVVIEINPRMSGSAIVGSYAGLNLFENLIDLYLNKSIKKFKINKEILIVPYKQLYKTTNY